MSHERIMDAAGLKLALLAVLLLFPAQAGAAPMLAPGSINEQPSVLTALAGAGYIYLLAIVISLGVAMLIKLLGKALKQFNGEP